MEEENEGETPEWLGPAIPKDMKYNEFHLEGNTVTAWQFELLKVQK
jgi:CYTH domain-containing protein